MNLKRYIEVEKICNENCGLEGCEDCDKCIYRDLLSEYETGYPLTIRVKDKVSSDISNSINSFRNFCASHHKKVYQCCVCGAIEAPYFRENKLMRVSIHSEYGWGTVRVEGFKPEYICHHCLCHSKDYPPEEYEQVKLRSNKDVLSDIKETAPKYYLKHKEELERMVEGR